TKNPNKTNPCGWFFYTCFLNGEVTGINRGKIPDAKRRLRGKISAIHITGKSSTSFMKKEF
ncbi:hypothetical protein, partial [uncultured Citrobacter sp.]|uniref:hypothetical protein n=1 Tax=uncultured Citrobacter sp. TaxID=200446 RepID=UPI002599A2CB